jgi:hypothetical protein
VDRTVQSNQDLDGLLPRKVVLKKTTYKGAIPEKFIVKNTKARRVKQDNCLMYLSETTERGYRDDHTNRIPI